MNIILVGILGYISLQLLLGVFISRKIHTEDDFLLAGRKLGYSLWQPFPFLPRGLVLNHAWAPPGQSMPMDWLV